MSSAACTWNHVVLGRQRSTSSPVLPYPSIFLHRKVDVSKPNPTGCHRPFWSSTRARLTAAPRFSSQPPQGGGGGEEEEQEEGSTSSIDTSLIISDDLSYLWKLAAGSIGGASAIKYGSILYPDITRPNLVQALLMIALLVLVAALILVKESGKESHDDFL